MRWFLFAVIGAAFAHGGCSRRDGSAEASATPTAEATRQADQRLIDQPRQIDQPLELPEPADELERAIQERSATEAYLMIPAEGVLRGELNEHETRTFAAALRAGLCYKVLGQAAESLSDLDLLVHDPNGVLLQRDATQHAAPVIGVQRAICPTEPGLYHVDVRAAAGSGRYAVQVWVSQ